MQEHNLEPETAETRKEEKVAERGQQEPRRPAASSIVEALAKAMCRNEYKSGRSIDEQVSPSRQLWQRFEPEAKFAIETLKQWGYVNGGAVSSVPSHGDAEIGAGAENTASSAAQTVTARCPQNSGGAVQEVPLRQMISTGSSNMTIRLNENDERVSTKCLCLKGDFADPKAVALHIGACILGQTITDENELPILEALRLGAEAEVRELREALKWIAEHETHHHKPTDFFSSYCAKCRAERVLARERH